MENGWSFMIGTFPAAISSSAISVMFVKESATLAIVRLYKHIELGRAQGP